MIKALLPLSVMDPVQPVWLITSDEPENAGIIFLLISLRRRSQNDFLSDSVEKKKFHARTCEDPRYL